MEIHLDGAGHPVDILKSERLFSHRVIEECMLAANVATARFLKGHRFTKLSRIHEPPEAEDLQELQLFLNQSDIKVKFKFKNLQKTLNSILEGAQKQDKFDIFAVFVLRAMKQAQYSSEDKGHFGLNFPEYVHFTSPIRRYADLVTHRQIRSILKKEKNPYSCEELGTLGTVLSACEQRSVKAERFFDSIKKARYMEKFLGRVMKGKVSSVKPFGLFVSLENGCVEGLLSLEELPGKFQFDTENLCLRSANKKQAYFVGDSIEVKVGFVNIEEGHIDLAFKNKYISPTPRVFHQLEKPAHERSTKNFSKRKKAKGNRQRFRKKRVSRTRRKNKGR